MDWSDFYCIMKASESQGVKERVCCGMKWVSEMVWDRKTETFASVL